MNILELIKEKWRYKYDNGERWSILDIDGKFIEGDCEDYSLTVLYHYICDGSLLKFIWFILSGKASMWYVITKNDNGHAVMHMKNYGWIDNWSKDFLPFHTDMEKNHGHQFKYKFNRFLVLIKIFKGKFILW